MKRNMSKKMARRWINRNTWKIAECERDGFPKPFLKRYMQCLKVLKYKIA